ncbi:MAG: type II toxin-antitoxin system VapC family toxin [Chloroflexi bacterium]|nr:type II toxin-antitoxin system VapC family toxin [Chloroflexota bacterium]
MDLLLDTNALLWWLTGSSQPGGQATAAVADPRNRVYVSAASAWEIAMKYGLGKLLLLSSPSTWLVPEISANRFTRLPISLDHALAVDTLPKHHTDPFDRLIIAQASAEGTTIVTGDDLFQRYQVAIIRC